MNPNAAVACDRVPEGRKVSFSRCSCAGARENVHEANGFTTRTWPNLSVGTTTQTVEKDKGANIVLAHPFSPTASTRDAVLVNAPRKMSSPRSTKLERRHSKRSVRNFETAPTRK